MTETAAGAESVDAEAGFNPLLALGSVVLRSRRVVISLGVGGAMLGLWSGLSSPKVYVSGAIFVPQGSAGSTAGLALAASQFGLRIPSSSGEDWQPAVYVSLLHSAALLEQVAFDTVEVVEEAGRRAPLIDLLEIRAPTEGRRVFMAVRALRRMVAAAEDRRLNAVTLSVATHWPSVSLAVAQRLVRGVNEFNSETRRSQAAAERQFVEAQAAEAERTLRTAEDRLLAFLQRNRDIEASPELAFQNDRLRREVSLRQQVYTSLVQAREDARIREVRDTPVITVLEEPRLAAVREPRRSVAKGMTGGLLGGLLGVLFAYLVHEVSRARRAQGPELQEFLQLVEEITPRFRGWLRRS